MLRKSMLFTLLALAPLTIAQTRVSGALDCEAAEPNHTINIPEKEGSVFAVGQNKCTWTKPLSIEGLESKDLLNTTTNEVFAGKVNVTAVGMATYSNGDKLYTRSEGAWKVGDSVQSGKWSFAGGTGKLERVSGSGTFSCRSKGDLVGAGYVCNVEGLYTVAAAPRAPAAKPAKKK